MNDKVEVNETDEKSGTKAPPVERLVMRDVNDYEKCALEEIDRLDASSKDFAKKAFNVRNDFLRSCGWDVSSAKTVLIDDYVDETFIYKKGDELFICEHDAIDYELYGA